MAKNPLHTRVSEETRKGLIMVVRENQNQNVSSVVRNTGVMSVKQQSLKLKGKNSLSIKIYALTVDGVDTGETSAAAVGALSVGPRLQASYQPM